ncbi:putative coatomer protein complex subunit alpha [Cryptosporidium canis]|uniref:Coatomer protein complex subunit alpha n=1 Tax=Cryptosporidium canis TaxID=195482 RepID=A0ABQ8P4I1_9CRYT|nr:putative coatomer protein complex subunit alpha [Cryptosporidium canis]
MLIKCESKSTRAKGLSFHPKLPWVLVSLHNGVIQFWDYRIGSLLDTFEEHEGPVRGIDFHESQPIFVSGGDDYRVKVWNYKERKCLFTLLGHLDYIRTVEFHKEYPWILSCSDDQTMRLWNWQSRTCISVITGHNHYVMCSIFHPHQDLLASASMDQSVRIWDFTGLREKTVKGYSSHSSFSASMSSSHTMPAHVDMFGANDVLCKFVLEGHERGVNWVAFHPTLSLLASASDDRTIKLWRYSDTKAWEIDTLRGHFNNVSSVIFHSNKDWLLSNSEDRTIRIWDLTKRACIHTYRRESDRFWTIVSHPTNSLFAAGHDSGMIIFKLEPERAPADFFPSDKQLWYINDRFLYMFDVKSSNIYSILPMKSNNISNNMLSPSEIHINPFSPNELCFLVYYRRDIFNGVNNNNNNNTGSPNGGVPQLTYDIITINSLSKLINNGSGPSDSSCGSKTKSGIPGVISVVFLSRNRLVALENGGQTILIVSLDGDIINRWELPWIAQKLYMGRDQQQVIIQSDDFLYVYNISRKEVISELAISNLQNHQVAVINNKFGSNTQQCLTFNTTCNEPGGFSTGVRAVQWSNDKSIIAIVCEYNIIFTNHELQVIATYAENLTVISGIWHESHPIFIYTTQAHIKYAIPGMNESGIIQTIPDTIYLQHYEKSTSELIALNRFGNIHVINELSLNEALFKVSVMSEKNPNILGYIDKGSFVGLSTLNYLSRNGYPEMVINMVENPILKFYFTIQHGDILHAYNILKDMQTSDDMKENTRRPVGENCNHRAILPRRNNATLEKMWDCLGRSALAHGYINVAEKCLQVTKEFEKLTLLYYVIGQREYLEKLGNIFEKQKNWIRKYHLTLLTSNVPERINILKNLGHLPLAIALAHTYGYNQIKEELLSQYTEAYSVDGADAFEFLNVLKTSQTCDQAETKSASRSHMTAPCIPVLTAMKLSVEGLNWPTINVSEDSPDQNKSSNFGDSSHSRGVRRSSGEMDGSSVNGGTEMGSASQQEWDDIDNIEVPNDIKLNDESIFQGVGGPSSQGSNIPGSNESSKTNPGPSFQDRILCTPEGVPATSSRYSTVNLIVAGKYEDALTILLRKMGVKDCGPFKHIFKMIALSSTYSLPSFSDGPTLNLPLISEGYKLFNEESPNSHISPIVLFSEAYLIELVKSGQKLVTSGKFQSALDIFQQAIIIAPLIMEHYSFYSKSVDQLKQLSELIHQYCIGMRLELARIELLNNCQDQNQPEVVIRNLELISYFTCCKLQPLHTSLVLRRAMGIAWKNKNYVTTAGFAKRLLGIPNIDDVEKTQKILAACDQKATDEYNINFDPHRDIDHIIICSSSLTKINPKSQDIVKCPVCSSSHLSQFTGEVCPNCKTGEIGLRVIGIL